MKKFIITIDTEGDNLWNWKTGDKIHTENTLFLNRFQELANQYGFKPVWLSNYEMISDERYLDFISNVEFNNNGELGMHLHAWNTPPHYDIPQYNDNPPYLIEYPYEIMEAKIAKMTEIIVNKTGISPVSHRAGRWATDNRYFELLSKYGYKIDCSITPHINWSKNSGQTKNSKGTDYSLFSETPFYQNKVLEVPVTVVKTRQFILPDELSVKGVIRSCYHIINPNILWLRPNGHNLKQMMKVTDIVEKSEKDYLMFMIHSSELMPGGSPTFKSVESIDSLYKQLDKLFSHIANKFEGCTLKEYYNKYILK